MKTTISALLFLFLSIISCAQNWEVLYGSSNKIERGRDVIETYDKGYLLVSGWDSKYIWVIKTDVNGNILWEKTYCNNDKMLYINKVIETSDNGYVMVGSSRFYDDQNSDPIILKFNSCFEKEWCKILYKANISGFAMDVIENTDGLLMILTNGNNNNPENNINIYGMTLSGDLLWGNDYARTEDYPLLNETTPYDLIQIGNSYYTSGWGYYAYPSNPGVFWLRPFIVGIDSNFEEKWILPFGMNDSIHGQVRRLSFYNEDTILSTGYKICHENNETTYKSLVIAFNSEGEEIYWYTIENDSISPLIEGSFLLDIAQINDGLYIGNASYSEDLTIYPLNEFIFNKFGNVYNAKFHENYRSRKRLIRTYNDKFLQCANFRYNANDYDALLYKYNENLEPDSIYQGNYTYDSLCPSAIISDTTILDDCLITGIDEIPSPQEYYAYFKTIPITVYPNPANNRINFELENTEHHKNITLKCFNLLGKQVFETPVFTGQKETSTVVSAWPQGMYVTVVYSEGMPVGQCKFVVQ